MWLKRQQQSHSMPRFARNWLLSMQGKLAKMRLAAEPQQQTIFFCIFRISRDAQCLEQIKWNVKNWRSFFSFSRPFWNTIHIWCYIMRENRWYRNIKKYLWSSSRAHTHIRTCMPHRNSLLFLLLTRISSGKTAFANKSNEQYVVHRANVSSPPQHCYWYLTKRQITA